MCRWKGNTLYDQNVLYVKDLRCNLFSVRRLQEAGFKVVFENNSVQIYIGSKLFAQGQPKGKLYELRVRLLADEDVNKNGLISDVIDEEIDLIVGNKIAGSAGKNLMELWHKRLGHLNKADVFKMINGEMVNGVNVLVETNLYLCEPCIQGKQSRKSFNMVKESHSSSPLEIV